MLTFCGQNIKTIKIKENINALLQFFSVSLVHFSDQNWNSQNYLFNLHINVSLVHIKKSSFSFLWTSCKCLCTFMQMIMYISLLFPTLSIAYVMLIKMYGNGSLLNSLTPTTFRHCVNLYMQNGWRSCHNMSSIFLYISIRLFF